MSAHTFKKQSKESRTRVLFDLADVLTPDEIVKFESSAKEAGAKSLTDHFLNLTIRLPKKGASK